MGSMHWNAKEHKLKIRTRLPAMTKTQISACDHLVLVQRERLLDFQSTKRFNILKIFFSDAALDRPHLKVAANYFLAWHYATSPNSEQ